ncbi:MAG: GMC family oxidoreductase N-terminal domain-containing protein [Sandaracinaceae bacterium]|nr:GMC family oxidoreductase N-terminal domain-containing protein [Sandaracinaceae bacterium]
MSETFDYVVVGGGSAGCVVAAQLAADPRVRVLLLECGPSADENPETLDADGYKHAFANDAVIWDRFSQPQPNAGKQRLFMGTGRGLGGSGAVNGMVYTRGAREDWDEWPSGWRWDDVREEFERLEATLRPHQRPGTHFTEACIASAEACGFRRSEDFHDGDLSNTIGYEWMSYEGQARRSSYVAFIRDAPARPNLRVETHARVHRIVLDEGPRVSGVRYEQGGTLKSVDVRREVVMCAGSLETPKLLMLSGIGPASRLNAVGVTPIVDVPEIGQNLQDHPNVTLFYKSQAEVDAYYPQLYSFGRANEATDLPAGQSDTCLVYWPAPSAMKQAAKRMLPGKVLPASLFDTRAKAWLRSAVDVAMSTRTAENAIAHMYGIVVILGKPKSRGQLWLASNDPRAQAAIDPAYFTHPEDMQTMLAGVRWAQRIAQAPALAEFGNKPLMPGKRATSDAALRKFVEKNVMTTFHFAGTCRMGDDAHAPVDLRLRLRGVRGLRIADASITPSTPVSAMNAPSMLIGYRAAREITRDYADAASHVRT